MFTRNEKLLGASAALGLCLTTAMYVESIRDTPQFISQAPAETHIPEFSPVVVNLKAMEVNFVVDAPAPLPTFTQVRINRPISNVPLPPRRPVTKRQTKTSYEMIKKVLNRASFPSEKPRSEALGYAATEDNSIFGENSVFGAIRRAFAPTYTFESSYDRQTAVYKISDQTVYLPDGTRLEAHSGLGEMRDNPHYVHVRMRGPTPPHMYELTWRESLFHGVKAIRLNPVGGSHAIYNRDGLLAHTYMLDPRGASNGCISFRDYEPFMRAFAQGMIKKVAVVP